MNLVKIRDVRAGQIWQLHNLVGVVLEISNAPYDFMEIVKFQLHPIGCGIETESVRNVIEKHKLIGFIGITHEIKDRKLVEMSRAELEVDDVVEFGPNTNIGTSVITEITDGIKYDVIKADGKEFYPNLCNAYFNEKRVKQIGVLGVTHEFVNERLAK